jgi:hypothetical protein
MGAVPVSRAHAPSERSRSGLSPAVTSSVAVVWIPTPRSATTLGAVAVDRSGELSVEVFDLGIERPEPPRSWPRRRARRTRRSWWDLELVESAPELIDRNMGVLVSVDAEGDEHLGLWHRGHRTVSSSLMAGRCGGAGSCGQHCDETAGQASIKSRRPRSGRRIG